MDLHAGDNESSEHGEQLISTTEEDAQSYYAADNDQPESVDQVDQVDQLPIVQDEAEIAQTEANVAEEPAVEETSRQAGRRFSEVISRMDALTAAIERHPDAAVNYVLRGEALIGGGDYDLAAEDFQKALDLAGSQAEIANWGYINRALADRARAGLRQTQS